MPVSWATSCLVVNSILSRSLNHRQFQALLTDITIRTWTPSTWSCRAKTTGTDMHAHITAFLALLVVYLMTWSRTLALVSSPLWGSNFPPVSQESVRWLRTSSCLPPPVTIPWTTPLRPADGIGGATLQCWTEGEVLQFFSSSLLPRHRPPF